MTRFQKIIIALVSVGVILIAAAVIVVVNVQVRAEHQASYERCLASHGFVRGHIPLDQVEQLARAAESCS